MHIRANNIALFYRSLVGLAGLAMVHGCGAPAARPPMGPPDVGIVVLQPQDVTITALLPGRTVPYAVSDVRPQINGIIKAQLFEEGSDVRAGQILYQVDPATYHAAYEQALAQLASARATLTTAKLKTERYADLVKINAVSLQDADDANAGYLEAEASVSQYLASARSAKINLDYTAIRAPISGRIGASSFTKGALVTAGQTTALTTIQTLDPIYVDIRQSAAELLRLRESLTSATSGEGAQEAASVSLKFDDGRDYPVEGRLKFTGIAVDQSTGAVTLRALFPNPKGMLLPGLGVRAVVNQGTHPDAILAPQQGVTLDDAGRATAMVVDAQDKAQRRILTMGKAIGDNWIVNDGLKPGDRLIVEGLQRVRPGIPVHAVPAGSPLAGPTRPARN